MTNHESGTAASDGGIAEPGYESAVAIIGMSGRFPGAATVDEFWQNLAAGQVGLRQVTDAELARTGISPALLANPNYVRTGAPLDGIELFDAALFGFSRREAEHTEPQHRLFLECCWEALEAAGYAPGHVPGKVGVFAGCGWPDYLQNLAPRLAAEGGGDLLMAVGVERDSLVSLVSYKLDLRGPSVTVQTFCSTSLVAVHVAVQSLLTYESDMALAGGAHIALPQPAGYLYEEGGISTPDGQIRSFDAAARGTVMGNGVAVVALKRMTEAIAEGDTIHAVILGSAVNNDGRACVGYTAPGVDGQAEVMEMALGVADVKPDTVDYIECHATGTLLGDSIELEAMSRVFERPRTRLCVLSSVKPSIGHLDRAAGVAGLIRATQALRHRVLPQTPRFDTPNPALAAVRDRFEVLRQNQPWPADHGARRAGVSSFGLGGTNAHVILEEAPPSGPASYRPGPHLLVHSARNLNALYAAVEQLADFLGKGREICLADVAYTLQQSRSSFALRWAVVCSDYEDALAALGDSSRWIVGETHSTHSAVALRIPDPQTLPPRWSCELWDVLHQLRLAPDQAPLAEDQSNLVQHSAVRALAAALTRLGLRVTPVAERPAAQHIAARLAAELGDGSAAQADVPELSIESRSKEPAAHWLLASLAALWQAGVALDWSALHHGAPRRVTLPTYPFQRQRYWIQSSVPATPAAVAASKNPDRAQWTYLPSWRRQHVQVADRLARLRAAGPWLVFAAEDCGEAVARHLAEAGVDVTIARPGPGFVRTGTAEFLARPDHPGDLRQLLAAMAPARTIIHAYSLASSRCGTSAAATPSRHFDEAQAMGFYSVQALVRTLADAGAPQAVDLILVTEGAVGVLGPDLSRGEHASLVGLAPVLAQETPELATRHVDVDGHRQAGNGRLSRLAAQIVTEAVTPHAGSVAWREGSRWVRSYEPQPLLAATANESPTCASSTVLITGGLGMIGLILARHLAARGCSLVLTARSPLPPRELWPRIAAGEAAGNRRTMAAVRGVIELEKAGARVLAMSADAADDAEMAAVVHAARERFGAIDAVVHGAGAQDARFFGAAHGLERSVCEAHFRAKVHGFHVLQSMLDERTTRRVTMSSLSAVLGGIRLGPYAAANAALDAAVLASQSGAGGHWLTVNWDTWQRPAPSGEARKAGVSGFEMTGQEGVDIFDRGVAAIGQVGQVVVSTGPLQARLDQWVTHAGASHDVPAPGDDPSSPRDPRPALQTPFAPPSAGTESVLAEIWADVLGLDRVGAEDDFYELGGTSLMAIGLTARVRRTLQAALPVTALLENTSVRQLAVKIAAHTRGSAADAHASPEVSGGA
jgi:acyl transferase domain-containing protein